MDKILQLIDSLREELNKMIAKKGFLNKEVLEKSRELDEVLNKYYKLLKK